MKPDTWCKHELYGWSLKFKQVQNRIAKEHCFVWVKFGEVFRNATIQEAAQMRKAEAKLERGLVYFVEGFDRQGKPVLIEKPYLAEQHGLKVINLPHLYEERHLARDANLFAINCENAA